MSSNQQCQSLSVNNQKDAFGTKTIYLTENKPKTGRIKNADLTLKLSVGFNFTKNFSIIILDYILITSRDRIYRMSEMERRTDD